MFPQLHLIGIFHTQINQKYSHCAFTGKVLRFPKMMQAYGYSVIEYSNEGSESKADKHIPILNYKEFEEFFGVRKNTDFHGDDAVVGSKAHQLFEERLIKELKANLREKDIICHPFGHVHQILMDIFPSNTHVETGIGYPTLMPNSFRIFESYAWMHFHQGRENRNGKNYEWVVPNYFDLDEWKPNYKPGKYLAYLGRITSIKGMDTIRAIADHSPLPIVLHGQGDPSPWQHPNIEYRGPISGTKRSGFLRNARALLAPSLFTEPFCGMAVEAMLCGTPVISVDYGAMTETVIEGVTGFRCHTLQDWLDGIENVSKLNRKAIASYARNKYSLEACGAKYDKIFQDLDNLWRKGWYELKTDEVLDYEAMEIEEKPFADRLAVFIEELKPDRVIDLGCGPGMYVYSLRNQGVDAVGYDIDNRIQNKKHLYCESLFEVQDKADFVMCLEVAEHIDNVLSKDVVQAVKRCSLPGGTVLWSAAAPGQGGVGHINCQTKKYWDKLFAAEGFVRDDIMERYLLDYIVQGYHMGWFVNNFMIFKNVEEG